MRLALFDLDHTVLEGDSDQLWGDFLRQKQLVDDSYQQQKDLFYQDYCKGRLNIKDFIEFCGQTLMRFSKQQRLELGVEFQHQCLEKHLRPKAKAKIAYHQKQGDCVVLISATNRYLVNLSASLLNIPFVIASEFAIDSKGESSKHNDQPCMTKLISTPAFQEGKVIRIREWLEHNDLNFKSTIAYSDSHNDMPLLKWVDKAVAVNPDEKLKQYAVANNWEILDWRPTDFLTREQSIIEANAL